MTSIQRSSIQVADQPHHRFLPTLHSHMLETAAEGLEVGATESAPLINRLSLEYGKRFADRTGTKNNSSTTS